MLETLTAPQETHTPQTHSPEGYQAPKVDQDFHLPGDSHVAKGIDFNTKTGEFVRKVISPNHLGQLEVKYLPHEEVVAVKNSQSYDHLARH
jgi:hypothetical protein